MSNNLSIYIKNIADAIRTKTGSSSLIDPQDFSTEIANIPSGGTNKLPQLVDKTVTTITAEDLAGATSIGNQAFYGCSNLQIITIPDSVTSIGSSAFYNCSSLTSITTGGGVTSIGASAFGNCSSLTSITIPDNVTSIGSQAFFSCTTLASVTIGSGVTSIGSSAFNNCSSLTSITIGSGVTSIGNYAFNACGSIKGVYYTGDIASWCGILFNGDYYPNPLQVAHNLYINNALVTEITIPDTVTAIKANAFYGWNGTSVTIGNGVTSIGTSAFNNCSSLTSITIGSGVTSIGNYALSGCSRLTSITIPDSVASIGQYAFYYCSRLTSITVLRASPPTLSNVNAFNNTHNCPIYVPYSEDHSVLAAYQSASNWSTLSSRIQEIPS